jgi:hypothetical protein
MAKRIAKTKGNARKEPPPSRSRRKEPYDSQRLSLVVDRLREQAARVGQLARAMEEARVAKIVVDGHAMLVRGLNQIDNFSDNASRALREAKSALSKL